MRRRGVAKKAHCAPITVRGVNDGVDWSQLRPGQAPGVADTRLAPRHPCNPIWFPQWQTHTDEPLCCVQSAALAAHTDDCQNQRWQTTSDENCPLCYDKAMHFLVALIRTFHWLRRFNPKFFRVKTHCTTEITIILILFDPRVIAMVANHKHNPWPLLNSLNSISSCKDIKMHSSIAETKTISAT